jgi:hypothetical protein
MRQIVAAPTDSVLKPVNEEHHRVSSTHEEDVISPVPSPGADNASSSGEPDQVESEEAVKGDPLSVENVTGRPAGEPARLSV